jgi:protein-tyrosine kinase
MRNSQETLRMTNGTSLFTKATQSKSQVKDVTSSARQGLIDTPPRRRNETARARLDVVPGTESISALALEENAKLVQQVFFQGPSPPKVVLFAGYDHGSGCSGICAQTARTLTRHTEGTICLVEANVRSPSLPATFGTPNHYGLSDSLLRNGPIRSFATPVVEDRVWLLSSGAPTPDCLRIFNSERLRQRMEELRSEFDYVVIDAAPLSGYPDALMIGRHADGLIMILEAGQTRREASIRSAHDVRAAGIPILGAVLNKRTFPIPEPLYRRL